MGRSKGIVLISEGSKGEPRPKSRVTIGKRLYGAYLLRGDHVVDIELLDRDGQIEMITQFFKLDKDSPKYFWETEPYDKWIHRTKDVNIKIAG